MKNLFLLSGFVCSMMAVAEQSANIADYAQPRPDSTVKENITVERQVTQSVVVDGKAIEQSTQTFVQPASTTLQIEAPAKSLLPAQIYDDSKDLEATMKLMGRNFKALHGAENIEAMAESAAELSKWASQAEALGIEGNEEDKQKYIQGMQHTRHLIADLEVAIQQKDEVTVRTLMNELGDTRKKYHRYFDVN